jgi:site-specific DNA-methyltransferase (adenine-specific)
MRGAYIAQINRLIFVNNFLILAKGRSARLSRRRRRDFRPSRGNLPLARACAQPFATDLINTARDCFRYEWIWLKSRQTGFSHAKNKPMKKHENILVFSEGTTGHQSQSDQRMPYYPQGLAPNDGERIVNFDQRKQIVGYQPHRQRVHLREFTGYPVPCWSFPSTSLGCIPSRSR